MAEKTISDKAQATSVTGDQNLEPVTSYRDGEIVTSSGIDEALSKKMELVNDAIDTIGFTPFHVKMFCLSGFGYAADSLLAFLPSITSSYVVAEFTPSYNRAGQLSLYIGLLAGALVWGSSADIIGRKWAFNLSLFFTAIFATVAGGSPNYAAWGVFNALLGFGAGGNLALDTTVLLEFLPHKQGWTITLMAAWWGVGQTIAGFIAWGFLPNYSCSSTASTCTKSENMGWRYVYITAGALVLAMSIARVTVIRFKETPKYSLCRNDDEKVVEVLQDIAKRYNRHFDLTVMELQQCGQVRSTHTSSGASPGEVLLHIKGLFKTRKDALSTALVCLSWAIIGLAYPLFYIFLPDYLSSRGAEFGESSAFITWRNYVITNTLAIPGPIIAACLCRVPTLGRRYTMAIGAVISMAFLLAYTTVRNDEQNLGFSCAVSVAINIYYGTLYAYTPEVLPSAHRATGSGISLALNRFMGIMSVIVATFASTATEVPVYLCAALFGALALAAIVLPYEPAKARAE